MVSSLSKHCHVVSLTPVDARPELAFTQFKQTIANDGPNRCEV